MRHIEKFNRDNAGVAAIEFALILPVLLLILLGVIEFGIHFMREQAVQRTTTTTASAIQLDPSDATLQTTAYASGVGLVDYSINGNYICAKAYTSAANAKSGLCAAGDWLTTAADAGVSAGTPYYVALVAYVQQNSITSMFNAFIPAISVVSVFKVGGASGETACKVRAAYVLGLRQDQPYAVTFSTPFPSGVIPIVVVTPDVTSVPSSTVPLTRIFNVTNAGFTAESQRDNGLQYIAIAPANCSL